MSWRRLLISPSLAFWDPNLSYSRWGSVKLMLCTTENHSFNQAICILFWIKATVKWLTRTYYSLSNIFQSVFINQFVLFPWESGEIFTICKIHLFISHPYKDIQSYDQLGDVMEQSISTLTVIPKLWVHAQFPQPFVIPKLIDQQMKLMIQKV